MTTMLAVVWFFLLCLLTLQVTAGDNGLIHVPQAESATLHITAEFPRVGGLE